MGCQKMMKDGGTTRKQEMCSGESWPTMVSRQRLSTIHFLFWQISYNARVILATLYLFCKFNTLHFKRMNCAKKTKMNSVGILRIDQKYVIYSIQFNGLILLSVFLFSSSSFFSENCGHLSWIREETNFFYKEKYTYAILSVHFF